MEEGKRRWRRRRGGGKGGDKEEEEEGEDVTSRDASTNPHHNKLRFSKC